MHSIGAEVLPGEKSPLCGGGEGASMAGALEPGCLEEEEKEQPGPGDLRQPRGRGATALWPFPSPSTQGPGCLMGSLVPPPGSRETRDWLGS